MAVKGPKGDRPAEVRSPDVAAEAPPKVEAPAAPAAPDLPSAHQRERSDEGTEQLLGEGRIGEPSVTPDELMAMGPLVRARHLMTLLARRRRDVPRETVLKEAGDLLLGIDPAEAKRLLLTMGEAGRIVDVYPLEVLVYVLEKKPLPGVSFGPIIQNKRGLEAATFTPDQVLRLKIPLAMRIKGLALEGGPMPGYCFAPGPPGAYHLQFDEVGEFSLILRGEQRRKVVLDRLRITVESAEVAP